MQSNIKWQTVKLCYITDEIFLGRTPVYSEVNNTNYIVGQRNNQGDFITLTGVKYGEEHFYKSRDEREFLKAGDILLNTLGTGSVGRIGYWDIEDTRRFLTDGHIMVIRANKLANSKFLYYVLSTKQKEFEDSAIGSTNQAFLTVNGIYKTPIFLPDLNHQKSIASFLDKKCFAIECSIKKLRESIEEYKKIKQAIITEAVTKGVRGKRPMKDSGIDWIGQIPKEWNVIALRYIGQCQNGISKGAEYFGTGYPFISYSDVYKNIELPQTGSSLVESSDEERERYSVRYGDIFFTRTSETIEEIGFTSVCLKTIENATFAGFLIRVRPYDDTLNPAFAKYYFRSDIHRRYFVKEMIIVIRASLGQELLKKLPVLIPSQEEQRKIADYLDKKCAAIDTLIEKKQQFIEELTAYKKSLIYEYVTGKKEVPA